jgi:hypothetical protein
MLYGIDNILHNIPHIPIECGEYYVEYFQSHKTFVMNLDIVMFATLVHEIPLQRVCHNPRRSQPPSIDIDSNELDA